MSTTNCCRRCSIRSTPWRPARRCCTTRMSSPTTATSSATCTARSATSPRASPRPTSCTRATYSTSRVQHVHLETHGSIAWQGDDKRWHVRTSSQGPFAAQKKLCYLMGLPHPRPACLHRARRRRLRRQAGDDLRGPRAVCDHEARPPREVGMDARGGVHWRHDAAPDDDQDQDRRPQGRHPDGDGCSGRVQHRRLRQPRQRDPGRRHGEPDRGLSLREQEGRRLRRLHQHGAGRRLPRLRRLADDLRHRMRDRRPGAQARHRPDRDAPQERRAARRQHRDRSGRSRATPASAATASTNASTSSSASWPAATTSRSPPARSGRPAPAWRSPCWNAARRPSIAPAQKSGCCPTAATTSPAARPRWATASPRRTSRWPRRSWVCARADIDIINADTDRTPYDTGTFASTGTVVAGKAVDLTAEAMREDILDFASRHTGTDRANCRLDNDAVICGNKRVAADRTARRRRQGRAPLHRRPQGLPVAAHHRLQRAGRAAGRASRDRRDPHPAQRARRRHRPADQPHAVPRPARWRHRDGLRLGAHRKHGP